MGKSKRHRSRDRSRSRSRRSSLVRTSDLEKRLERLESLILRLSQPPAIGAQASGAGLAGAGDSPVRSRSPVRRDDSNPTLRQRPRGRAHVPSDQVSEDEAVDNQGERLRTRRERSLTPSRDKSPALPGPEVLLLQDETDLDRELTDPKDNQMAEPEPQEPISADFLDAIGLPLSQSTAPTIEIPTGILNNMLDIMASGLLKDQRDKLLASYVPAESAATLGFKSPALNAEIASVLTTATKAKDHRLQLVQQRLLSTLVAQIAALRATANLPDSLQQERRTLGILLADMGKMSADAFNLVSTVRREALFPFLSKTVREASSKTPARAMLFGETIMEDLKKQKSMESMSRDLKASSSWAPSRPRQQVANTSAKSGSTHPTISHTTGSSLNSKGPYRQRMGTRAAGQSKYPSQKSRR